MAAKYCQITRKPTLGKSHVYLVNTDNFSPQDLDLFVESMEIISRYERKRQEERNQNDKLLVATDKSRTKKNKTSTANQTLTLTSIDEIQADGPKSMLIPQIVVERRQSTEETADEPITHLEAKKLLNIEADETYYSAQESMDNSPLNSLDLSDLKLKSTSDSDESPDSEESGVFPVGEPFEFDANKQQNVRQRSAVINKPQQISPKSKAIGLALKRNCVLSKAPSLQDLNLSDDVLIAVEHCDRALAEIMNLKYDSKVEALNRRQGFALDPNSSEEHLLDRALSLLQL